MEYKIKKFLSLPDLGIYRKIQFKQVASTVTTCTRYLPLEGSHKTTSEISNNFSGNGMFRFLLMVLSIPGSNVVLATCRINTKIFQETITAISE
jgi:hypothetical protein